MTPLLATLALLVPLGEAVGSLAVKGSRPGLVRRVALVAAVANLAVCLWLAALVIHAGAPTGLRGSVVGVPMHLDAMGAALLAADAALGVACVTFSRVIDNARSCFATMGLAQLGFAVAFLSDHLLWLWAGWALSALSLSALMAEWGGGAMARRWQANVLPVVLVVGVAGAGLAVAGTHLGVATVPAAPPEGAGTSSQLLVYGLLLAACAATMGIFPLHFWLAEAHRSLAAGPALMLDGGLFSLAFYVLARIACVLAPAGYAAFSGPLSLLSAVTVVYGGLCLAVQTDLRRANAYCSVCYAGIIGLALSADPVAGGAAALLLACGRMLASALFAIVVWTIRTRTQTVDARELSGIASTFPLVAALLVIAVGSLIALPPASTFSGLLLAGAAILAGPVPVACLVAMVVGYALMVISLVRLALSVCIGAPSAPVAAYVHHLEVDPFDIIVAGQRVPVGLVVADAPDELQVPTTRPAAELTGDLAGLADFEMADPPTHEAVLISRLHEGGQPLAATDVASPKAAGELDLVGELRGIGDRLLASPDDGVADGDGADEDEWDALQELYSSVAPRDDWGDEADGWDDVGWAEDSTETLVEAPGLDADAAKDDVFEGLGGARDAILGESEQARREREEAQEDAAWDALEDDDDEEWDGEVVVNPRLVVRGAADAQDSERRSGVSEVLKDSDAAEGPFAGSAADRPDGGQPAEADASRAASSGPDLRAVLEQQSLLIDVRAYDQAATTSSRAGVWHRPLAGESAGRASQPGPTPATMPERPAPASAPAHTDSELLDVMLENIVAIDRGSADRRDDEDDGRRRRRVRHRPSRAVLGERPISPGDPEAHETLPDYASDASFRRSTLTWAEYMTCALLVAASVGLGLGQGFLLEAVRRVLAFALGGA